MRTGQYMKKFNTIWKLILRKILKLINSEKSYISAKLKRKRGNGSMNSKDVGAEDEANKRELFDSLKKQNCFFFTGSGISLSSQVASVSDVLGHTCNVFLPEYESDFSHVPEKISLSRKDYICNYIQPELFYSILLDFAQDETVLGMWNCLKQDHYTKRYIPKPNFIHYFIVVYSYLSKVPIFTMNYDKMFESACEMLNIPYSVHVDTSRLSEHKEGVAICKLHGDLQENTGDKVTSKDIGTTMSSISKKNSKWLQYINANMKQYDMCIWGYSGRDIDYFPFIKDYPNTTNKKRFWAIGNPEKFTVDGITKENASLLPNVRRIKGYPSSMEEKLTDILDYLDKKAGYMSYIFRFLKEKPVSQNEKDLFLRELAEQISTSRPYFDGDLLWMQMMRQTGHNNELKDIILGTLEKVSAGEKVLKEKEKFLLYEARIFLARERADFLEYRKLARNLYRMVSKSTLSNEDKNRYCNLALVQYVSSLQMCIPSALALHVPVFQRRYGLLILVRIGFAILNFKFNKNKYIDGYNKTLAQECKLRTLAIDYRIPFLKGTVWKQLKKLREQAYEIGNYETVIGANKYLGRLDVEKGYFTEADNFAKMVSDLSALSIINRNHNPDEALNYAIDNGNNLNIVKAIFQKKDLTNRGEIKYNINNEDKERLLETIHKITPKRLSKTLLTISKREGLLN
jgi:hypothetical protein